MAHAQLQRRSTVSMPIFDNSLERLFALLRIKSISRRSGFRGRLQGRRRSSRRDIATLGFAADIRPTAGHPAIVAKANGGKRAAANCSVLRHTNVQPAIRQISGTVRHSNLLSPIMPTAARSSSRAAREDDKGQLMTLSRPCRAWKSVPARLAGRYHHGDRGEEESVEEFRAVP